MILIICRFCSDKTSFSYCYFSFNVNCVSQHKHYAYEVKFLSFIFIVLKCLFFQFTDIFYFFMYKNEEKIIGISYAVDEKLVFYCLIDLYLYSVCFFYYFAPYYPYVWQFTLYT